MNWHRLKYRKVLKGFLNILLLILLQGDIKLQQQKPDEAKAYFEKVIKNAPKDQKRLCKAWTFVYQMKKNNSAAIAQFEKAISINPNLIDVLGMVTAIHLINKKNLKGC